jgi:Protein of unknown function (DUF3551)
MRETLIIVPASAALLMLGAGLAVAQERPWCLVQSGPPIRCGFHTFEQCLGSLVGGSSHCSPNPAYTGDRSSTAGSRTRARERPR